MLWAAESIYEGTWGSGPPPPELVDFELMRYMRWSWRDLDETPEYVRRYCWDLMQARLSAERDAHDKSMREQELKREAGGGA